MKMTALSPPSVGMTTIYIEHAGQSLKWDVSSVYSRSNDKNPDVDTARIFQEINDYWATLSPEVQDGIFEAYSDIRRIFDNDFDLDVVNTKLRSKVGVLYQYMPLPKISQWLRQTVLLRYPTTVKARLDPNDIPQRTYIQEDYFGLACLATAFRPMIPIWGEFIARARLKKTQGANNKELRAFGLLYNTKIIVSPEVRRLRDFIAHSIAPATSGNKSFTTVLSGLSTSEQPDWFLSLAVIRRLAVLEIQGLAPGYNIVATIFRFVESKVQSMDRDNGRQYGGRVGDKKQTGGSADDNNTSIIEMYKIKPVITKGTEVQYNVFANRLEDLAMAREPELDMNLVRLCRDAMADYTSDDLRDPQKWLVRWVMSPTITPRAIDLLTVNPLFNAMAVTQAILWHWGFPDLAALVTACPVDTGELTHGSHDSRSRLNKEIFEALQKNYPYHSPPRRSNPNVRHTNPAVMAIDRMVELLSQNPWRITCPDQLLALSSYKADSRIVTTPVNVKVQLSGLILHPKFAVQPKREKL